MNTASAPLTAASRSVVKLSRPAAALLATSWSRPGSKIGISPRCKRSILPASLSTQMTETPNSEKHAPETRPTYPVPIIAIRIGSLSEVVLTLDAAQNGLWVGLFPRPSVRRADAPACWGRYRPGSPLFPRLPTVAGIYLMSQSILVTGGAGYVGSHACKALAAAGYRPVVYDNLSRGHREAVRWGPLLEGELLDTDQVAAALQTHRVTAVMHFAAYA